MRKRLAKLLRAFAQRLDPLSPREQLFQVPGLNPSDDGGKVVEVGENPQWHPDQTGNVIIVEPILVSKERRASELPKVQPPF